MSLLKEIEVRAKWDGSFSEAWTTIRNTLHAEGDLKTLPGRSDMQKLKTWSEAQGLIMDFEIETVSFSTAIRTVTFWNGQHAPAGDEMPACVPDQQGDLMESEPAQPAAAAVEVGTPTEYFDWDAVDCR